MVHVHHDVPGETSLDYYWTPSDQQYFDVYYEQYDYSTDADPVRIEATLCTDYISGWDVSLSQKKNATQELEKPLY